MGMEERLEAGWATDALQAWSPGASVRSAPQMVASSTCPFVTGDPEFEEEHGQGEVSKPKQAVAELPNRPLT